MTKTIKINNHHHMVGVHSLCLCNCEKITDFSQVTAASRIVLPAFIFFKSFIYNGYKKNHKAKAASANNIILFNFVNMKI